jgi:hypothetical protein
MSQTESPIDTKLNSYCGFYCGTCSKFTKGQCEGCKGDNSKCATGYKSCQIRPCCIENGYNSCVDCDKMESVKDCKLYNPFIIRFGQFIKQINRILEIKMIKKKQIMKTEKKTHLILSLMSAFLIIASYWMYLGSPGEDYLVIFYIVLGLIAVGIARIIFYSKIKKLKIYRLQDFITIPIIMYTIFIHGNHEQEMLQGQHLSLIALLLNIAWFLYGIIKF